MSGTVISFINMKGGVGKTSLAINVSKTLADRGKRVLILDMDPQFNATQSLLLYKTRYYKIFSDLNQDTQNQDTQNQEILFKEEIKSTEIYNELSYKNKTILQLFSNTNLLESAKELETEISTNLYLVPGDLNLAKEISGDTSNKCEIIYNYFEEQNILEKYDYVIIDCPPTWSILTHASLYVSDYYIIPSKVDLYSSVGIKILEELIDDKIYRSTSYKNTRKVKNLDVLKRMGIIFTLVYGLKSEKTNMERLKKEFKEIEFFETVLPYIPSVPTRFIIFDEVKNDSRYTLLINSINKITEEIINKK